MCAYSAIDNGANFLAEGFLFTVAAGLILGETWRSSRNQSKRRDDVDDRIEDLQVQVRELGERIGRWETAQSERGQEEQARYTHPFQLSRITSQYFIWTDMKS